MKLYFGGNTSRQILRMFRSRLKTFFPKNLLMGKAPNALLLFIISMFCFFALGWNKPRPLKVSPGADPGPCSCTASKRPHPRGSHSPGAGTATTPTRRGCPARLGPLGGRPSDPVPAAREGAPPRPPRRGLCFTAETPGASYSFLPWSSPASPGRGTGQTSPRPPR